MIGVLLFTVTGGLVAYTEQHSKPLQRLRVAYFLRTSTDARQTFSNMASFFLPFVRTLLASVLFKDVFWSLTIEESTTICFLAGLLECGLSVFLVRPELDDDEFRADMFKEE